MTFPTTITRYIFWEVAKVFLVTLSVLVFVLVMVGIVQESVRKGLTLSVTFQLIPYVLPNALCFAIPGTILFSTCSAYGQMSANNEITALKSAGVSPIVALRPVLIFALILSLGSVWLIDIAFSWGFYGVQEVITSSVDEIAYSILSSQKHLSTDRFSCNVMRVQGRRLIQPTITIYGEPGTAKMTITAREATMDASPGKGDLRLTLTDGVAEVENQMSLHFKDSIEQVIHLTDAALGEHGTRNPSHMRLKRIPAATELQELRIEQLEQRLAIKAAYEMVTGDFTSSA